MAYWRNIVYNKFLEPLLGNDPAKVIRPGGIKIRKMLYPLLRAVVPLTLQRKIVLVEQKKLPKNEPFLFASTHGFREDAEAAYIAIGRAGYFLNGSIDVTLNTKFGITNWIAGMILVDRADKESRRAAKEKMIFALRHGASVIMYPEGTWNKSPNQVVSGLFFGFYDVAKAAGVRVVPVGSHRTADTIYVRVGDAFSVSNLERDEARELLKEKLATLKWELIERYSKCARTDLPYGDEAESYWQEAMDALMAEVPFYDYELEKHTKYVEKDLCPPEEAFAFFQTLTPRRENAVLFRGNERWMR